MSISMDDSDVPLTRREFELAWMLFDNLDKILSREYLLRNIWNVGAAVQSRTVDTYISRVRSKLNLRPENGWRLSSVYHYGYRLGQVASVVDSYLIGHSLQADELPELASLLQKLLDEIDDIIRKHTRCG